MLGVEGLEPWTGKDSLEAFARTEIRKCCKEQWGRQVSYTARATLTPLPMGPTDQARTSVLPALSSVSAILLASGSSLMISDWRSSTPPGCD